MVKMHIDKEKHEIRVQEVFDLLVRGKHSNFIIAHCKKEWGLGKTIIYSYIKAARELMSKWREQQREELIDEVITKLDFLYEDAVTNGNAQEARNNLKEKVKILGLEAPKKLEIDSTQKITINFNLDE